MFSELTLPELRLHLALEATKVYLGVQPNVQPTIVTSKAWQIADLLVERYVKDGGRTKQQH